MKRTLTIAAIIAVILLAVGLVAHAVRGRLDAPRYITQPAAYADISASVQETGTVNPVDEVQVGTQVSGTIAELLVDYNSIVKKGQVLATLDPTSLKAAATQAQAGVDAAEATASASSANVDQMVANVNTAEANVRKASAQLVLAQTTVSRDRQLLAQGYIAPSQMDTDQAAANSDLADLNAEQTAVAAASAQHSSSQHQAAATAAQIESAQGQLGQAQYNLQHSVITSPIDGVVVSRNVSVGQTVAASFQTPTLFVIASSLKDMQVDVSVDEADVGQLRVGQSATITVPAYPNTEFRGTVQQVRVNPVNVQNVVTYDTVVAIHDASQRLKPGMTATVTIAVATRPHVLSIPVAALLYRPQAAQSTGSNVSMPIAGAPGSHVVIWVLRYKKATRVPIVIGISDGKDVEVVSGDVHAGDEVVVGQLQGNQSSSGSNPLGSPRLGGGGAGR